jgi:glutaredoxin
MLSSLGIKYEELHLNQEYTKEELMELVGPDEALTVPQIIINGKRIGGFEALQEYVESYGIMGLQS